MSDINSLFAAPPAPVAVDTDVSIDFETRSAMDLKACGAHRYSRHPSTDVLIAVFRFSKHDSVRWYPGDPLPARVRAAIEDESVLWHAHNAAFEIVIWQHVMVERYGMPALPIDRWSCTMVRCLMAGLPAQLDKAAPAAGLPEEFWKDDTGSRVMKQVSKPRKRHELGEQPASWAKLDGFNDAVAKWDALASASPWAAVVSADREFTIYRDPDDGKSYVAQWWADEGRMQTLYDYCDQDTLAEWAIGERVPPLDETELAGWHMDQRINWRGYWIDTDFVRIALGASDRALEFANEEAREISNGYVSALTKPTEIRDWMNARLSDIGWSPIDGIGKEVLIVLRAQLQQELDTGALWGADIIGTLIRMIDLRTYEAKTSTRKLTAMLNAADTDDHRIRGGLQYAGAGRTARWAGRLVQPHNFPRPEKWATTEAQVESLIQMLEGDETAWMRLNYGGIGIVVSSLLRPCIAAAPGNVITAADFNAIEMRFSAWLTDCSMILGALNRNEDVYRMMAAKVFGYADWRDIDKDSFERMLGKKIVLGCGYQMGWEKFWNSCRDEGIVIDQQLAKAAVQTYRAENHEIKAGWAELERAGVEAVQTGRRVEALGGKVTFYMKGPDLKVVLPSGRELTYLRAYVKPEMKWGKEVPTVCFYGFNSERRRMEWQSMYGGRWMENITQAGSRDVLRDAIMRLDAQGWQIILSVHDEVIDESPLGRFTAEQMETEMARPPHWAPGLPLKVEGWQGPRYRK